MSIPEIGVLEKNVEGDRGRSAVFEPFHDTGVHIARPFVVGTVFGKRVLVDIDDDDVFGPVCRP